MSVTEQIVPGIYRWTCPHPEYRTSTEEVVSYALVVGDALALVDPLLPLEDDARRAPLLAELDAHVGAARRLEIMVTIPYHARSAEVLFERYWGEVAARLWGNAAVARTASSGTRRSPRSRAARPGTAASTSPTASPAPSRSATRDASRRRCFFPALKALAFGDAVVGMPDGSLRVWDFRRRYAGLVPRVASCPRSRRWRSSTSRPCS